LTSQPDTVLPLSSFQPMPKVDLHRHLEGSLRLTTMIEIARAYGVTLPVTAHLRPLVQVQAQDDFSFRNFLSKFQTLRLFYRTPEIIARVTREAVLDAAEDKVQYLELRFTPVALGRERGFSLADVMDWVCENALAASRAAGIKTRLIASVNRHESLSIAEQVVNLAVERISRGICGIDLAGNEAEYPAEPFEGLFQQAKKSGLHITVHAGEWSDAENVRWAIEHLGAERIGHGVRAMESPAVVALARERRIPFEVCITSNYHSGVVKDVSSHPFKQMLAEGLNVLINTDDPSICQITLSDEYRRACNELGLPFSSLRELVLAAGRAAFLPEFDRLALVSRLREGLNS
jgi:adenosine deaminase